MRATVIAVAALFFAAAGGSYAAGIMVGSAQIRDHSIRPVDLNQSVITALRGKPFDASRLTSVIGSIDVDPGKIGTAVATCPPGTFGVSGGGFALTQLSSSQPLMPPGQSAPGGWTVQTLNYLSAPERVTATAVCY